MGGESPSVARKHGAGLARGPPGHPPAQALAPTGASTVTTGRSPPAALVPPMSLLRRPPAAFRPPQYFSQRSCKGSNRGGAKVRLLQGRKNEERPVGVPAAQGVG